MIPNKKTTARGSNRGQSAGPAAVLVASRLHNARIPLRNWCRGWGSNPHDPYGSQDFKSCASASFATPAGSGISSLRGLLVASG